MLTDQRTFGGQVQIREKSFHIAFNAQPQVPALLEKPHNASRRLRLGVRQQSAITCP